MKKEYLELLNCKKKVIFSYLSKNNIAYKADKKTISFDAVIFEESFLVKIFLLKNIAKRISFSCTSTQSITSERFDSLIKNTKNVFDSMFGAPTLDSTNHMTENATIRYSVEKYYVLMLINDISYNNGESPLVVDVHTNNDLPELMPIWPRLVLYLGGGLLWGFLMFLAMSITDLSWKNFALWMSGGLLFAVLFGVFFEIFGVVSLRKGRNKPISKNKYDSKFDEFEKSLNFSLKLCGTAQINTPYPTPARMYILDSKVIVAYYKRPIKIIEADFDFVDDNLLPNGCFLKKTNKNYSNYLFIFESAEGLHKLIEYLRAKLYCNENFNQIYSKIDKVFKEYNPYSLLIRNEYAFGLDIYFISKYIYKNDGISFADLQELLLYVFNWDIHTAILEDLTKLIYMELYAN